MNYTPETNRRQNETLDDLLIRLGSSLSLYDLNWNQVADIMNSQPEIEDEYSESKYRKDYASYVRWKSHITVEVSDNDEYLKDIEDKTITLKKERIKLQSEKIEYNKMLREDSRNELLEEKILDAIVSRPTIHIPEILIKRNVAKRDYLFPVADIHYAAEFKLTGWMDEILNEYSPEIAQKRMWQLLEQYVQQNDIDKINHVHLFNLGDSLDGILRMSQLQWIKMGNVDSAIEFGEFMSQWLNELSKHSIVDYYAVGGNHTQLRLLNSKSGDFPLENMEKVISHIVASNLRDNKNVTVHKCKNQVYLDILGTKVLGVHGHEENNLENSLIQYSQMYGHPIDMTISGHKHHYHEKTIGMNGLRDIKFVQVSSIIGIDDFSLKIKKTSNASANLMTIQEDVGRVANYEFRVK